MNMQKCVPDIKYQILSIINNTPINIIEKNHTNTLKGFAEYIITIHFYQENDHLENCYICSQS